MDTIELAKLLTFSIWTQEQYKQSMMPWLNELFWLWLPFFVLEENWRTDDFNGNDLLLIGLIF